MINYLGYLILYAYSDFINGVISGIPGPLIPFLAAKAHVPPTSYSFVFTCRSAGAVLGALFYKILQVKGRVADHHKILGVTSVMFFLTLFLFEFWYTPLATGILLGIYSGISFVFNIALSCSLLIVPQADRVFFWLSISNGSFGFGSLVAPLVVDAFTQHAFTATAVLALPIIVFYFFIVRNIEDIQKEKQQSGYLQVAQDSQTFQPVSTYTAVFLGLNLFLLHGIENINGGWLPTYASMTHIASKKQAALFATTFWLTYTIARYVSGFINTTVTSKLKRFSEFGLLNAILSAILAYANWQLAATSFCAVFQGISISGIYPLSLAIPSEYKLRLTQQQISSMMILMMVSEAIMVAPTGHLMQTIYLKVFFLSLVLFNCVLLVNSRYIISLLEKEASKNEEIIERGFNFPVKQIQE